MPEIITEVKIRELSPWNSMFCSFCSTSKKNAKRKKAEKEAYCSAGNRTVAVGFCECGTGCEGKARAKATEDIKK